MIEKDFPYICPDHPAAQIRHEWTEKQYVMNGYPTGTSLRSQHQYYCNECGRELAEEKWEIPT
jgi:hypothetical protein